MLKKLIKYDMRETYKVTVWLAALELLLFLICFTMIQWVKKSGIFLLEEDVVAALSLIFTGFVALISGILIAESIYLYVHYYKTMHGDRAYLSRTLPMSTKQLLTGKVISISTFYAIVYVVWVMGYFIIYNQVAPAMISPNEAEAYEMARAGRGIDLDNMLLSSMVGGVFMIPCNSICAALAFALGQLLPKNKVFFGVVFYLCISWTLGVVVGMTGVIIEFNAGNPLLMFTSSTAIDIALFVCMSIFGFHMTCRLLDRKVDLE